MAAAYKPAETRRLVQEWLKNPVFENVNKLAVQFNRTPKSIIAKLSKEGVYERRGYVNKQGNKPRKKEEIVASIEEMLATPLQSLEKADKATLLRLEESIKYLLSCE